MSESVTLRLKGNRLIIEVPIQVVPMIVRARLDAVSSPIAMLTLRERQVLEGIVNQESNKEIGARLHLSERTVKHHVSQLLGKLGASTRYEVQRMFR